MALNLPTFQAQIFAIASIFIPFLLSAQLLLILFLSSSCCHHHYLLSVFNLLPPAAGLDTHHQNWLFLNTRLCFLLFPNFHLNCYLLLIEITPFQSQLFFLPIPTLVEHNQRWTTLRSSIFQFIPPMPQDLSRFDTTLSLEYLTRRFFYFCQLYWSVLLYILLKMIFKAVLNQPTDHNLFT